MSLVIIVFFLLTLIEGYNTYLDVLHNTISTFLIEDYIFDGLNYLILKTEIGVEADQYIFKTDVPYNHINNLSDTVYTLLEKQKNIEDNKQYIFSSLTKGKNFIISLLEYSETVKITLESRTIKGISLKNLSR